VVATEELTVDIRQIIAGIDVQRQRGGMYGQSSGGRTITWRALLSCNPASHHLFLCRRKDSSRDSKTQISGRRRNNAHIVGQILRYNTSHLTRLRLVRGLLLGTREPILTRTDREDDAILGFVSGPRALAVKDTYLFAAT
jgi:hypothetical protein